VADRLFEGGGGPLHDGLGGVPATSWPFREGGAAYAARRRACHTGRLQLTSKLKVIDPVPVELGIRRWFPGLLLRGRREADAESLMEPNERPIVRVRLRHSRVSFLRFPLTADQAERMATGDRGEIRARNPLDITIGPPVCERCGCDYETAPWSCYGEAMDL